MKKITILIVAILTLSAQQQASAQVVEEGNMLIDVYYGFPNLYSSVFRTAYANSGTATDISITGFGPVGGRFEYLLTDKVGLGIDIGTNNTKLNFKDQTTDNNGNPVVYNYNYKTQKIGAMVTLNYHFIENDHLDFYGMFGMGYGNRSFTFKSTDPNYVSASAKSYIPVASRLGIGIRYFFTENIGANLGLGIGQGGLINVGLSVKI